MSVRCKEIQACARKWEKGCDISGRGGWSASAVSDRNNPLLSRHRETNSSGIVKHDAKRYYFLTGVQCNHRSLQITILTAFSCPSIQICCRGNHDLWLHFATSRALARWQSSRRSSRVIVPAAACQAQPYVHITHG